MPRPQDLVRAEKAAAGRSCSRRQAASVDWANCVATPPAASMADIDASTAKLAELLRHPEDLEKIAALKADFSHKKAAVDGQLRAGLKEQLEITQSGMTSISDSQRIVNQIKEEMMNIDKLCAESQDMIKDFPNINIVSQIHRNFQQVQEMKTSLETFNQRIDYIEDLLQEDERDLDEQPRLLEIHYELTQLRDFRDEALSEIRQASDSSFETQLLDYFNRLDDVVDLFDANIGHICANLIRLLLDGRKSTIVRMALIIEQEEKNDLKVKAMQEAQKEHKELASRFKSIKGGPKEARGYKEKFVQAIGMKPTVGFANSEEKFMDDPSKLEKGLKWYFNDLNAVKIGMVELMPKKWKIFKTYTDIYHSKMHDFLTKLLDDDRTTQAHLLAIIHWRTRYYEKMKALGNFEPADLLPDVIDDREQDLIRNWRQNIVNAVDQWMDRMFENDRAAFDSRSEDALEKDANGFLRTKTLPDMWRMLREQLSVATDSGRPEIVEGVLEAMFRTLKKRQSLWSQIITAEVERYNKPGTDASDQQAFQDCMVAMANDAIACIDDNEAMAVQGYLTSFAAEVRPMCPPGFLSATAEPAIDSLRDGYIDLGAACITGFIEVMFNVDFKAVMADMFTQKWYSEYTIKRMTATFEDYMAEFSELLHPSLVDMMLDQLAETLLIRYVSGVRNKGAKFKRQDPFADKIGDDVRTAFAFFEAYPEQIDFTEVKNKWKVVHHMVRLLEADKASVGSCFAELRREFGDVQISWVEAVLRSRDDYERAMMNAVRQRVTEGGDVRTGETVLGKVK